MPTTLVVSNDFPPRIGGIERFVSQVCGFCDDDVIVLTSTEPGASPYDAGLPYEVVRHDRVLLPTRSVAREARALLRRSGASRVPRRSACWRTTFGGRARSGSSRCRTVTRPGGPGCRGLGSSCVGSDAKWMR